LKVIKAIIIIGIPGHLFFFAVLAYLFCINAVLRPHV